MCTGVTWALDMVIHGPSPFPLLPQLGCLPLATPRVLLEYVSCRPLAHLHNGISLICPSSSDPTALERWWFPCAWLILVYLPWFTRHIHLPYHLQASLAKGASVPTLPVRSLSVILTLKGLSQQVKPCGPLSTALSPQLSVAPFGPAGHSPPALPHPCRYLGRACCRLLHPCLWNAFSSLSTWRIFF